MSAATDLRHLHTRAMRVLAKGEEALQAQGEKGGCGWRAKAILAQLRSRPPLPGITTRRTGVGGGRGDAHCTAQLTLPPRPRPARPDAVLTSPTTTTTSAAAPPGPPPAASSSSSSPRPAISALTLELARTSGGGGAAASSPPPHRTISLPRCATPPSPGTPRSALTEALRAMSASATPAASPFAAAAVQSLLGWQAA